MDERKVAVIPQIVVPGALGPKEYGVLLTDRRAIFVLQSSNKAALGAALGGVIGAAVASAAAARTYVDYQNAHPEALAQDEKNVVVPYASMQRLRLKKGLGSYSLLVEYVRGDGKVKKLEGALGPPAEQIRQGKATGLKAKEVAAEYAEKVQIALQAALPPEVAGRAEWVL